MKPPQGLIGLSNSRGFFPCILGRLWGLPAHAVNHNAPAWPLSVTSHCMGAGFQEPSATHTEGIFFFKKDLASEFPECHSCFILLDTQVIKARPLSKGELDSTPVL